MGVPGILIAIRSWLLFNLNFYENNFPVYFIFDDFRSA